MAKKPVLDADLAKAIAKIRDKLGLTRNIDLARELRCSEMTARRLKAGQWPELRVFRENLIGLADRADVKLPKGPPIKSL